MLGRKRELNFDVSTGLKRVLGRELITDDEVAIFELVKNSFDAKAKRVDIYFGERNIVIADNGVGMSYDDLKDKWLKVAYSSKREANNFRDDAAKRRYYAGSKGIGRFSSDRLGEFLVLQSRPKSDPAGVVHSIVIDWDRFDADPTERFEDIKVTYRPQPEGFILPNDLPSLRYGTVIEIKEPRKEWDRDAIVKLKAGLAKLINPFGSDVDRFRIFIWAPACVEQDKFETDIANTIATDMGLDPVYHETVNGEVGNFIFDTLKAKTTFLEVWIEGAGAYVESRLTDRGEVIYQIREPNTYSHLVDSNFRCELFFLNRSAKTTFTRRMGLSSASFGSVFLFRNGFRVFPIGEETDDWFGIQRRKQQGMRRFLGTRDIIGRIDVNGKDADFQEASSRNQGLIRTDAVDELRECFREHCLKRLERYVIPVTWADAEDKDTDDVSRLLTDPGKARVTSAVASLVDSDDIELISYSKRLIGILNERSAQFEDSLTGLRSIAEKTGDKGLSRRIDAAERRYEELKEAEAEARRRADEERAAKEAAQARAAHAESAVRTAEVELADEQKRSLFLSSIISLDVDTIINMHHQITIYADEVRQQIENFLLKTSARDAIPRTEVISALEQIAFLNRKVIAISQFATKANFRLQSEMIDGDMADYIVQYIDGVAREFLSGPMVIEVTSDGKGAIRKFKPIDLTIVVDNLISNSRKARATKISFELSHPHKGALHMKIVDDGQGLDTSIRNVDRIFEKGFTRTDGSGLGLYHVRHVLGEMNGTIEVERNEVRGTTFLVRIAT